MKARQIICIKTESVPKGLVPDKHAILLVPLNKDKWVALEIKEPTVLPVCHTISSDKIFLI